MKTNITRGGIMCSYGFLKKRLKAHKYIGNEISKTDPSLYYYLNHDGLTMWSSLIDDFYEEHERYWNSAKENAKKNDCPEECEMKEYVGCKIECNQVERSLKMTQLVLMQSFEDEFEIS